MTSPESTSDSSWGNAYIPTVLATDDTGPDPGSVPPRHQTSLHGIDVRPQQRTEDTLARPVMYNQECHAATRVMSPNTMRALGNDYANPMTECNTSLLLGQHMCQVCEGLGSDMMVCAECGTVGHAQCLKMSPLEGFWFCQTCYGPIRSIDEKMWADQKHMNGNFI